jgi:cytochrome c5
MLGRVPGLSLSRVTGAALLVGACSLWVASSAAAQGSDVKIWDGVFSAAQTERGKAQFEETCARCHNVQLTGSDRGPALKGDNFFSHWENESIGALFLKVRDQMPPNLTGAQLEPDVKLAIVSYILRSNNFPVGREELKVDLDRLDEIQIVQKGASASLANFALVQVVGCLKQDPTQAWMLTNTSAPVPTRDQGPTPAAAQGTGGKPLGQDTYRLLSVARFKPHALSGQKVEAKGLLYKAPSKSLLDLTSLQAVAPSCGD